MEEVLPAVQQASGAQGVEVAVGAEALAGPRRGWIARTADFLRDVRAEVRKVTWPTWPELKKATTVIVIFVMILGVLIGWMDWVLQLVFVKLVARLF